MGFASHVSVMYFCFAAIVIRVHCPPLLPVGQLTLVSRDLRLNVVTGRYVNVQDSSMVSQTATTMLMVRPCMPYYMATRPVHPLRNWPNPARSAVFL